MYCGTDWKVAKFRYKRKQLYSIFSFKSPLNGAHTKRLRDKTSPRQNVAIQNVYTHNVSLTKRLRNEKSPVTKRLRNQTSPGQI
jgi:hypothetical protein